MIYVFVLNRSWFVGADCGVVCDKGEFLCSGGRCILYLHRCDGHDDCGDLSDERGYVLHFIDLVLLNIIEMPSEFTTIKFITFFLLISPKFYSCQTLILFLVFVFFRCVCSPGEFQCPNDKCVPANRVCDGHTDCPTGTDEAICPSRGKNNLEYKQWPLALCNVWIKINY